MNSLVIPPSPNWYEANILTCAIDGTIIYGSYKEIVVIKPKNLDEPADIRIIPRAHSERVLSVAVSPAWDDSQKLIVTAGEDKRVKLWDAQSLSVKSGHNGHTTSSDKVVGAVFAGNDRIVSVSEDGFVIIWRYASDELVTLNDLFAPKAKVCCVSSCPHAGYIIAFGLRNGLIVITDLRRNGRVLYRLRGHESNIVSLVWCPVPQNVLQKRKTPSESKEIARGVLKEILDNAMNSCVVQQPPKVKQNPWVGLKHADDDEIPPDYADHGDRKPVSYEPFDFLSECSSLRNKIVKVNEGQDCGDSSDSGVEEIPQSENDVSGREDSVPVLDEAGGSNRLEESVALVTGEDLKRNVDGRTEENDKENVEKPSSDVADKNTSNESTKLESAYSSEFLLASSARGGSIIIWRVKTDGRRQVELHLPNRSNKYRGRRPQEKYWLALFWLTPTILLSSSPRGELLEWDLSKIRFNKHHLKPRLIHNDHDNNLFCIAAPVKVRPSFEDYIEENEVLSVWTTGQDRYLINTELGAERNVKISYPTMGGNVICFSSSPLDPNRLAIGLADGCIRVWDLSRPHLQYITMTNVWQKMVGRVYALAWHPSNESLLAFGTYEGRIGMVDTTNTSKPPILMVQYFRSAIYHLEWAPYKNSDDVRLYACAEGILVVFDAAKPAEDPVLVHTPENESVSQFSWKSDYTMLAVGLKTGIVVLYSSDLKVLHTFYVQKKCIQSMVWHPESSSSSKEQSGYAGWLASCSNDGTVVIYDCFDIRKTTDSDNRIVSVLRAYASQLKSLAWNPYEGDKLVAVSEEGLAQVWDVFTKNVLSIFASHNLESILAVVWSPLDPDIIITGGKDSAVRLWKVSEHPALSESEVISLLKSDKKVAKPEKTEKELVKPKKPSREYMLRTISKTEDGKVLSLTDDCERLFALDCGKSEEAEYKIDVLKLFGSKEEAMELLNQEEAALIRRGLKTHAHQLSLWKGDIAETVKTAVSNKTVTPFLISLAPMVSPKLWFEACEIYARQLYESPNFDAREAASYFLACHKVEDAINALSTGLLFREAIALAKSRLPENDPIIAELLKKWAQTSINDGNFELAAQCYIVLKDYEQATKVLFRRSDSRSLKLALDIAKKSGNTELCKAVEVRYNAFKDADKVLEVLQSVTEEKANVGEESN